MTVMALIEVTKQRAMYAQYMHASTLNRQRREEEDAVGLHKKGKKGGCPK